MRKQIGPRDEPWRIVAGASRCAMDRAKPQRSVSQRGAISSSARSRTAPASRSTTRRKTSASPLARRVDVHGRAPQPRPQSNTAEFNVSRAAIWRRQLADTNPPGRRRRPDRPPRPPLPLLGRRRFSESVDYWRRLKVQPHTSSADLVVENLGSMTVWLKQGIRRQMAFTTGVAEVR